MEETQAFVCPPLTQEQIRTVCRSTQAQRIGKEAGTITVAGVTFINNENCRQWDTFVTAVKSNKDDHFEGVFNKVESSIEPGHIKTQGFCRYKRARLLKGEKNIDLYVTTDQKLLFGGVQQNPMASDTAPKIGGEKVANPPEPEKKRDLIAAAKEKANHILGRDKPPLAPPSPEAPSKEPQAANRSSPDTSPREPSRKRHQGMRLEPGEKIKGLGEATPPQ
jgi:hypothetical protein